ncbi:MAG: TonB-dependent receptor, partial [Gammaproteobacteria bacterium]|nr:TonB-dependent receptor [Gammaproteobacteria bacterium]
TPRPAVAAARVTGSTRPAVAAAHCAGALLLAVLTPVGAMAALVPQLVVTAGREPAAMLDLAGNTARIEAQRIRLLGATHVSQLGSQAAGTWLARGTEQESLPSIRSPVLTGPGSCGAFLVLEDGIPIRPAGFCNVNELFEANSELASALEVVRGPSSATYGANGLHGTLNFLLPEPGARPGTAAGIEWGPHHYWRTRLQGDGTLGGDALAGGLVVDHDGDFRADAGYEQAKGFAKWRHRTEAGELELAFAGTVLDQETAGFISGYRAYEDPARRTANENPEAYRDADSQRLALHWVPAAGHAWAGTDLRAYLRRSRMDFLQHFLPGQPREENGQVSGGLMLASTHDLGAGRRFTAGLDLEIARGELEEFQPGESGIGTIPPGWHYDYDASSYIGGTYARLQWPLTAALALQLGLRVEVMRYDYDNRMRDGDTRDDGTPCTPAPCRFSRPADRSDDFLNVAPSAALLYRFTREVSGYVSLARGFRPPQAAELYRLQAGQALADLDSEQLDSIELGLHRETAATRLELAAFAMTKRNAILQDANRFNVSDGRSKHVGVELQADARLPSGLYASLAGTWSRQTYDFDSLTPGGERIATGNDIDTAPRTLASARAGYDTGRALAEIEWVHVGDHFLDAANTAQYSGHDLLNLRAAWQATERWTLTLRLNNLADEFYAERADFAFGSYRYFPGRERELYLEFAWQN